MSKAILIIDMPESCKECDFCYYSDERVPSCQLKLQAIVMESVQAKPSWCPLKPMPEKSLTGLSDYYQWGDWEDGYNQCIDEILGEENDK